jgi:hypothetical protein
MMKQLPVFILTIFILGCSSSPPLAEVEIKPQWINVRGNNEFMGSGEADSEQKARAISRADALEQIRLHVQGGIIFSTTSLEQVEDDSGISEIFQQVSKLSVEGYVQGTALQTFVEQDFAGRELIYRCYTLMAFDYDRYQKYLLEQTSAVSLLLEQIYESPVIKSNSSKKSDISALFRKIKVTSEVLSAVVEAAGKLNSHSELILANEEFSEIVYGLLDRIEITPQNGSIISNPYKVFDITSPTTFRLKNSQTPLSGFPYTISQGSEILGSGFTGDYGLVKIPRDPKWKSGDELKLTIAPALRSLQIMHMPHATLHVNLDYRLNVNVKLDSKVQEIDNQTLVDQIPALFEARKISVQRNDADGDLTGTIRITPSSTLYGLFYSEARAVLTLQPDYAQSTVIEYSKSITSEGKSYQTAGEDAFNNLLKELTVIMQHDLQIDVK